uniref:Cadherin domain-containing protein n=1 Tax=Astatotilapia calliptera TaxID=8154 RepID=A0AAX7SYJ4_ASTCA
MAERTRSRTGNRCCFAFHLSLLLIFGEQAFAELRYSIPEEMKEGTIVGNVAKDLGLDKTSLADRLLRVVSGSKDAFFEVNPDNGVTKSPLDREKQAIYDVTIVAKDAGTPSLTSVKSITIIVSDVNDNRPEFSANPYTFYVTENNLPGVSVFSVRASDQDEGENAHISYHILRDEKENSKLSSYSLNINSDNGEILALKSFDFESLKTFQFQVVASDSGTPSLSNNVTVNVFILDQNDNAPVILSEYNEAEGISHYIWLD